MDFTAWAAAEFAGVGTGESGPYFLHGGIYVALYLRAAAAGVYHVAAIGRACRTREPAVLSSRFRWHGGLRRVCYWHVNDEWRLADLTARQWKRAGGWGGDDGSNGAYRLARWTSFLDPWADQFATGYQLTQALIAFGRGHVTGTGLGNSVQKLHYLPEAHTDFIFAVVAEELGMIGAILVVLLFTLFIVRAMWVGRRAELAGHLFGAYVSYGIGFIVAAQAFINMAVSSGLLPTKGLTLPLISYGGSSLLVTGMMIGLLLRVDAETRHRPRRTPTPYRARREPRLS